MVGAFNTGAIPATKYNLEIYIIWLICTFLIFIVMLNMLIALVNDIFSKIHENIENNLLKEFVVLMVESELLISRNKLFEGKKYIIVVSKEKGEKSSADADSKVGMLKNIMDRKVTEQGTILEKVNDKIMRYVRFKLSDRIRLVIYYGVEAIDLFILPQNNRIYNKIINQMDIYVI